jgi:elongation factor Ts
VCLLDQAFIRDDKKSIDTLRGELITKTGENIQVRRFVRYMLGEK